ncbi:MAG: CHASE2 domain-containing protein [Sphingomonadaceae bacterium]|nr:CHASE2 domain-containing protein [Sphingomonadaceae bacterium]
MLALLLGCAFAWWMSSARLTESVDLQLQDLATAALVDTPDPDILLVTIDETSLASVGGWPWPRSRHAALVEQLETAGARAVVLDILFIEPSEEAEDLALAEAMAPSGNVVIPHEFGPAPNSLDGIVPVFPVRAIEEAAAALGHVAVEFDSDGLVRRVPLARSQDGKTYPNLALSTWQIARETQGAKRNFTTNGTGDPPILPMRQAGSYPRIPASAILSGQFAAETVADRIVLVGATARGLGDQLPVSARAGSVMDGVEIQANLVDAIKHDRFVMPVNAGVSAGLSILMVIVLFLGFRVLSPGTAPFFALGLAGIILVGALILPLLSGLWWPPGAALAALALSYPIWGWRRLASVVAILQRESGNLQRLEIARSRPDEEDGFDEVERQAHQLGNLVALVQERFTFIRTVVRNLPDPIVVLDGEGRTAILNERARDLFGSGDLQLEFQDLLVSARARLDRKNSEIALTDGRVFTISRAHLDLSGSGGDGEIVQFHEITALRLAENERRETMEFLSHDMRSPQVAILGLADDENEGPEAHERFRLIRAHARITLKLADDFAHLARLAEKPLELGEHNLCDLAEEAVDRAWHAARQKKVTLHRGMCEEPNFVRVDPSVISRVLDNLIGNAVKYTPEGSTVSVAVERPGDVANMVRLVVSDDGPGLPPDRMEDPFQRFGQSKVRVGHSLGLGLAFVGEAVRKHSGTIDVESAPGEGSKFTVSLERIA